MKVKNSCCLLVCFLVQMRLVAYLTMSVCTVAFVLFVALCCILFGYFCYKYVWVGVVWVHGQNSYDRRICLLHIKRCWEYDLSYSFHLFVNRDSGV